MGTPIGNLGDMTFRAVETLRSVDMILAEDTRRTRKLCEAHGISTPLRSFHAHSSERQRHQAIAEIQSGKQMALVTDAGMPGVSDPGNELVAAMVELDLPVTVIPGASALTAIIAAAGLPGNGHRFVGFLPRKGPKRREALSRIAEDESATIVFEAASRIGKTLADLAALVDADRRCCVGRELTKLHEEIRWSTVHELAVRFATPTKGEIVFLVEGRPESVGPDAAAVDQRIRALLQAGVSVREAADRVAADLGGSRRDAYQRALTLRRLGIMR